MIMLRYNKPQGCIVNWFDRGDYVRNANGTRSYTYCTFSIYNYVERHYYYDNCYYILPNECDTDSYLNNFISTIPDNTTLYFTKESNFPRVKLNLTTHKRCIKLEKADVIVVPNKIEIDKTQQSYYIFTDGVDIFGISDNDFDKVFSNNWNLLKNDKYIGIAFKGELQTLYHGNMKVIKDRTDILLNFLNKTYKKPFILDEDLDKIVNKSLPDPTFDDLKTMLSLLQSPDSDTIKLGSLMAAGYNITKWPLTFTVLLGINTLWMFSENGGNTVAIKQMRNTLNLTPTRWGGLHYIYCIVKNVNASYTKEDIDLAQKFVKTIPQLSDFCKKCKSLTKFNEMPFIPDEYKV